jgi:hypothetical protein
MDGVGKGAGGIEHGLPCAPLRAVPSVGRMIKDRREPAIKPDQVARQSGEVGYPSAIRPLHLERQGGRQHASHTRHQNPGRFCTRSGVAMPDSPNMMLLSDDGTDKCKNADKAQKFFQALILQAQT